MEPAGDAAEAVDRINWRWVAAAVLAAGALIGAFELGSRGNSGRSSDEVIASAPSTTRGARTVPTRPGPTTTADRPAESAVEETEMDPLQAGAGAPEPPESDSAPAPPPPTNDPLSPPSSSAPPPRTPQNDPQLAYEAYRNWWSGQEGTYGLIAEQARVNEVGSSYEYRNIEMRDWLEMRRLVDLAVEGSLSAPDLRDPYRTLLANLDREVTAYTRFLSDRVIPAVSKAQRGGGAVYDARKAVREADDYYWRLAEAARQVRDRANGGPVALV